MADITLEEARTVIEKYKRQNQQLRKALSVIHDYVDTSDARLEEEGRSRADILAEARKLRQEYERSLTEGMIIQNIGVKI